MQEENNNWGRVKISLNILHIFKDIQITCLGMSLKAVAELLNYILKKKS